MEYRGGDIKYTWEEELEYMNMEYKGKGDNFKNMELKVRRGINIRI